MVSQEFTELAARKCERAKFLAAKFPASKSLLEFAAIVYAMQTKVAASEFPRDRLVEFLPPLCAMVNAHGPELLREWARRIDPEKFEQIVICLRNRSDTSSPASFFGRVLLQPVMFGRESMGLEIVRDGFCPQCGNPPQVSLLRNQAHGKALSLLCSLCCHEWPSARNRCPQCCQADQALSIFHAEQFEGVSLMACEKCKSYLHCIDLGKCPDAIGDVDELAALPLDVWAQAEGYQKIQPNLGGI